MQTDLNFHLNNGIFFRREGDQVKIVKAKDHDDPGEVLAETDLNGLASIVSSASPWRETGGSFQYIFEFLKNGVMFCGGCGIEITPEDTKGAGGMLAVINKIACKNCFEGKFKPLFDWGMEIAK
jgi:hypothetical protein